MFSGGGGGGGAVQVATRTLSNAEVITLQAAPVTVLAARGANTIIVPLHATLHLKWVADYTGIDPTATLTMLTGASLSLATISEGASNNVTALLAGGGPDGTSLWMPAIGQPLVSVSPYLLGYGGTYDSDNANTDIRLVATNGGSNYGGGAAGNALKVTLLYYVATF